MMFPYPSAEGLHVGNNTAIAALMTYLNTRTRGIVQLAPDASQAEAIEAARQVESARKILESAAVARVIYVPRRIINLVSPEG